MQAMVNTRVYRIGWFTTRPGCLEVAWAVIGLHSLADLQPSTSEHERWVQDDLHDSDTSEDSSSRELSVTVVYVH